MVITRRRALATAGAGLLLGGCGGPEEPPSDVTLLFRSQAAEQDLVAAYARLGGELGDGLGAQAHGHVARLAKPLAGAKGYATAPTRLSSQPVGGDPGDRALVAARRALRVHLRAIGELRDPAHRALVADVMTADAQQIAILLGRLGGDPLESAFPDGRSS